MINYKNINELYQVREGKIQELCSKYVDDNILANVSGLMEDINKLSSRLDNDEIREYYKLDDLEIIQTYVISDKMRVDLNKIEHNETIVYTAYNALWHRQDFRQLIKIDDVIRDLVKYNNKGSVLFEKTPIYTDKILNTFDMGKFIEDGINRLENDLDLYDEEDGYKIVILEFLVDCINGSHIPGLIQELFDIEDYDLSKDNEFKYDEFEELERKLNYALDYICKMMEVDDKYNVYLNYCDNGDYSLCMSVYDEEV